jgi:hypothetical protein
MEDCYSTAHEVMSIAMIEAEKPRCPLVIASCSDPTQTQGGVVDRGHVALGLSRSFVTVWMWKLLLISP